MFLASGKRAKSTQSAPVRLRVCCSRKRQWRRRPSDAEPARRSTVDCNRLGRAASIGTSKHHWQSVACRNAWIAIRRIELIALAWAVVCRRLDDFLIGRGPASVGRLRQLVRSHLFRRGPVGHIAVDIVQPLIDHPERRHQHAEERAVPGAEEVTGEQHLIACITICCGQTCAGDKRRNPSHAGTVLVARPANRQSDDNSMTFLPRFRDALEPTQSFEVEYGQASVTDAHESNAFESPQCLIDALSRKTDQMR